MTWSAQQYTAFENERTRPVRDLVAAIPEQEVHHAIDLGCGPGNSTEVLAERFPDASFSGIDSSEDMIAAANKRLPSMQFEVSDIASWKPVRQYDVILANASLQWVPDHEVLYPFLVKQLAPGGSIAIQTPDNLEEPAHRMAREIAATGTWANKIGGQMHPPRHNAGFYYDLLTQHCSRVDVWRTTYYHPLEGGAEAVVEWFKGSALRPYLGPLSDAEKAEFLSRYLAAMKEAYPASADGKVLLPFPRLFIVASR